MFRKVRCSDIKWKTIEDLCGTYRCVLFRFILIYMNGMEWHTNNSVLSTYVRLILIDWKYTVKWLTAFFLFHIWFLEKFFLLLFSLHYYSLLCVLYIYNKLNSHQSMTKTHCLVEESNQTTISWVIKIFHVISHQFIICVSNMFIST